MSLQFCSGEATSTIKSFDKLILWEPYFNRETRLKVLELAKLTIHAHDFSTVA